MRDKNEKPIDSAENADIEAREALVKKIEVMMGPSEDVAPASTDNLPSSPTTAPEVSDTGDEPAAKVNPSKELADISQDIDALTGAGDVPVEEDVSLTAEAGEMAEESAEEPQGPEQNKLADAQDEDGADKVVDEIVAKESDDLLAAEDEKIAAAFVPQKRGLTAKVKGFFANWWANPRARRLTLVVLLVLVIAAGALPPSRYFVLNTAGVRAGASLTVLDDSTQQPLKNVRVNLAGKEGVTDTAGKVRFEKLKLGSTELVVEKRAFATVRRQVTLGWGSNPLADYKLRPVGSQYAFVLSDFLSNRAVENAEATSGESSAVSDKDGRVVLTIDEANDQEELKVSIAAEGYRTEDLVINANDKAEQAVKMAAARKHVFISKRRGKYDVYKIDVDGRNEELVLSGTGSEREDMLLVPHPTDEVVALVSTRDNQRNSDGFLLSSLMLIDLSDNSTTKVTQSERVQIVDWLGDRLVYVQIAAGTSAGDPKRHRLVSYDYKNDDSDELASSNYFNDVMAAAGQVYYAPSAYMLSEAIGFHRVNADGTARQSILDKEVWNVFRIEYDRLNFSVQQEWYDYKVGSTQAEKAKGAPAVLRTRIYVDSPDKKQSLWVDDRDGKGVLLAYNVEQKNDQVVRSQSGLKNPVRWLNNKTVIYRIHTDQETADYAMSLDGGEPVKVRDVSNTGGVDQWYYY